MKALLFVVTSLILSTAAARTTISECPPSSEDKNGVSVSRIFYSDIGLCTISVSPVSAWETLTYRDYSISSDGMFMVFNAFGSYGDFGVRNFFLFPRTQNHITYRWDSESKDILVTGVTGGVFRFDSKTAQLKSITGAAKVVVGPVSRNNRAGVEINGYSGQILDVGYAAGADPSQDRAGKSTFFRGKNSCAMVNRDLFNYLPDGDVQFKFPEDKTFLSTVARTCK